jgi:hypothetical protein
MVAVMVAATAEAAAIDLCQRRQAAQSIWSAPPPCAGRWHAHGARSLRAIAAELNNREIPTATGPGRGRPHRSAASWHGSPRRIEGCGRRLRSGGFAAVINASLDFVFRYISIGRGSVTLGFICPFVCPGHRIPGPRFRASLGSGPLFFLAGTMRTLAGNK